MMKKTLISFVGLCTLTFAAQAPQVPSHMEKVTPPLQFTINGLSPQACLRLGILKPNLGLSVQGENVNLSSETTEEYQKKRHVASYALTVFPSLHSGCIFGTKVIDGVYRFGVLSVSSDKAGFCPSELLQLPNGQFLHDEIVNAYRRGENLLSYKPTMIRGVWGCDYQSSSVKMDGSLHSSDGPIRFLSNDLDLKSCFFQTPTGISIKPKTPKNSLISEIKIKPNNFIYKNKDGIFEQSRTCLVNANIDMQKNNYILCVAQAVTEIEFNKDFIDPFLNIPEKEVAEKDKKAQQFVEITVLSLLGDANAQNERGLAFFKGDAELGIVQNYKEGADFFESAALQGHDRALRNLGIAYRDGKGRPKNLEKAYEFFLLSAQKGNKKAMENIKACLENGEGVEKDQKAALEWQKKIDSQ